MEENKKLSRRLFVLCGIFMLCLTAYCVAMFDAQIVHGAEYRAMSVRTNTVVEPVEASRGILTDRNGKVLVSNRAVYTLTFDPKLVASDELNDALLRLMALLRRERIEWYDELPLTATAPYDYDFDVPRSGMLVKYLSSKRWIEDGMTAEEMRSGMSPERIFQLLCEEFEIPDSISAVQRRALVGFR